MALLAEVEHAEDREEVQGARDPCTLKELLAGMLRELGKQPTKVVCARSLGLSVSVSPLVPPV